ncbi:Hypothetical predicted protein [Octopus vulgaris]|uniref:Uncharacterized protein n=1 Tax=Octopus vulgaris TaxID=6645 RepID=A0AA36BKD7_OCTVU|nr:Hypothetical predicted protein [Octopus vulgaris]
MFCGHDFVYLETSFEIDPNEGKTRNKVYGSVSKNIRKISNDAAAAVAAPATAFHNFWTNACFTPAVRI